MLRVTGLKILGMLGTFIYIHFFIFFLVANYNFMYFERHFAWPISPFKMHKIIFVPENLKKIIFVPENLKKFLGFTC